MFDPIDDSMRREIAIHDDGKVPFDGWEFCQHSNCHSPRSILKQFLEVKFKYINLRHFQLLRDIGVELAEKAYATILMVQLGGAAGVQDVRCDGGPGYRIAQTEQVEHSFYHSFALEKI